MCVQSSDFLGRHRVIIPVILVKWRATPTTPTNSPQVIAQKARRKFDRNSSILDDCLLKFDSRSGLKSVLNRASSTYGLYRPYKSLTQSATTSTLHATHSRVSSILSVSKEARKVGLEDLTTLELLDPEQDTVEEKVKSAREVEFQRAPEDIKRCYEGLTTSFQSSNTRF
jgi:hypothetical protein